MNPEKTRPSYLKADELGLKKADQTAIRGFQRGVGTRIAFIGEMKAVSCWDRRRWVVFPLGLWFWRIH